MRTAWLHALPLAIVACNTESRPPVVTMAPATSVTIPPSPPAPAAATTEPSSRLLPMGETETDDRPNLPPAPVPAPMPTGSLLPSPGCQPFDRGAAAAALGGVHLASCAQPGGPAGAGHVKIMFDVSGRVSSAVVDGGPFPGTSVGGCIARQFHTAVIPAFCGTAVAVGKSFTLQ